MNPIAGSELSIFVCQSETRTHQTKQNASNREGAQDWFGDGYALKLVSIGVKTSIQFEWTAKPKHLALVLLGIGVLTPIQNECQMFWFGSPFKLDWSLDSNRNQL